MNPTFRTISRASISNRHKNCYLCDAIVQNTHIRNTDQLFYEDPKTNSDQAKSLATILSDVLEQTVEESNVHSKIVCRKCQQLCSEYDLLSSRLQELRQNITNAYNETANKLNLKAIEMDLEQNYEAINEEDESNIQNMYAIESVDSTIGEVFNNENITSNDSSKSAQLKKVMLIKAEDGSNPFFTISDMGEGIDDHPAIHTVLLDEMHEPNDFGEDATGGNDDIDDEIEHHDPSDQYIVAEHLDDGKEYFESNSDQMIEISTNGEMGDSNYQYVFQDDSADEPDADADVDADADEDDDEDADEENSSEVPDDKVVTFDGSYLKSEDDGVTFEIKTSTRSSKKGNSTEEHKELFIRDGKKFQCLLCQPVSQVIYDTKTISIHLKSDHNERIYVCSICGLDFRKRNPYNDHMDEHMAATADGSYECEYCDANFSDARQFRIHKRTHNASVKIWPCKACGKKYSSKNLLDEHMNMHTGARPYKCPHCTKDFASKYTLTAHMKIHYDRKRPFECKECGKSFFSNQNLTQHVRTHTGVKEYECEVCNKKFGSQHNLEVHKIVHTGHKPFICRTCGKAFARRAEIKDHERTHTGERPYKCDMCPSSFAQRSNLMSHKRATHFNDKRYKCTLKTVKNETCSRSFKRRRLLEYHIKAIHTFERPYKCATCAATFVYPEHYKKHIRIHTGVKPFACEVCGKTFNSRDNRNAHRYVHSDKKPYECLVCHQGFMRKPLLYAHMENQQHLNDQIIVNQPDFKKDNNNDQSNEGDDSEIVYLSMNDEEFMDDDEFTLEEEHIVEDGEIINEEHLMSDSQFSGNGAETTDSDNRVEKQFLMRQKRQNLATIDELSVDMKDTDAATYIETADDSLNLEQMCVPVDGVNVSWIGLSS